MSARITHHAEDRSKERQGLSKGAASRTADIALKQGLGQAAFSGSMRRYLDSLALQRGRKILVYGEHVFVFDGEVLITVMQLPQKYKACAKKAFERQEP